MRLYSSKSAEPFERNFVRLCLRTLRLSLAGKARQSFLCDDSDELIRGEVVSEFEESWSVMSSFDICLPDPLSFEEKKSRMSSGEVFRILLLRPPP